MIDKEKLNKFVQSVIDSMPQGLKDLPTDIQKNLRSALHIAFSKMDLVTREEFDVQKGVLERTRKKVAAMEKKIQKLEGQS